MLILRHKETAPRTIMDKTSVASFPDQSVYMPLSSRGPLIGPREIVLAYLDRMVWERVLVSDMAWVVVWGVAWDEAKVVDLQEMLDM